MSINDTIKNQLDYVQRLEAENFDYGLVVTQAFVKSMRDIGYKSTATALAEEIDNSIEAGATNIHVIFDGETKPQEIAIADDGHGMPGAMIRAAILWGGTHRHGRRDLFGRYGFGLPSSCISQGRRFEVYSKTEGSDWMMSYIDLDEIADEKFPTENGRPVAPEQVAAKPPAWVAAGLPKGLPEHGTVVVIRRLDRLSWKTASVLEPKLLEAFGTTYRNLLRQVDIWVNGKQVEKVDPLFLDEDGRFYDENAIRAEALEPTIIQVKEKEGGKPLGVIRVRYAYMPPGFANLDGRPGSNKMNRRQPVLKDNNGILFLRAGRQIDVVSRTPSDWPGFQGTYAQNVKIEVDFDPALDEEFSVTTSKQQVVPSERVWEILKENRVKAAFSSMIKRYTDAMAAARAERESPKDDEKRKSEEAMEEAGKFRSGTRPSTPQKDRERREGFEEKVREKVGQGMPETEARTELEADVKLHPFRVEYYDEPEGVMFWPQDVGPQVIVHINRAHPFFTDLYAGPDSTPYSQSALEVLLLILGACEVDSKEPGREWYRTERVEWSRRFATTLRLLKEKHPAAAVVAD